jgi:murein DD-endopeptidase / murein LD-carboxypeptidase
MTNQPSSIHKPSSQKASYTSAVYIMLIALILIASCSRELYKTSKPTQESRKPAPTKTEQTEDPKLNAFLNGGSGKTLNTGSLDSEKIIKTASARIGTPHCMGGSTTRCMDCSGLLVFSFAQHGIKLPHNSQEQARYGKIIYDINQLRRGDLIFFINTYRTLNYITHSGIYLGNGDFLHTSTSQGVTITSISNPWWRERYIFGTRIF